MVGCEESPREEQKQPKCRDMLGDCASGHRDLARTPRQRTHLVHRVFRGCASSCSTARQLPSRRTEQGAQNWSKIGTSSSRLVPVNGNRGVAEHVASASVRSSTSLGTYQALCVRAGSSPPQAAPDRIQGHERTRLKRRWCSSRYGRPRPG